MQHVPRSKSAKAKLEGLRVPTAEPVDLPCGHPSTGGPVAATHAARWYRCSGPCGIQKVSA